MKRSIAIIALEELSAYVFFYNGLCIDEKMIEYGFAKLTDIIAKHYQSFRK